MHAEQKQAFNHVALVPNSAQMCRYDIILEENAEVSFKPLPCHQP